MSERHEQEPPAAPLAGFLLSAKWWRLAGWGVALALVGAVGALAFVAAVKVGQEALWPDSVDPKAFSGSWRTLVILSAAGLVVGVIHHFLGKVREVNVFAGLVEGRINPDAVPGGIGIALVSLIGGYSLGPEVPAGMIAGGVATKVAEDRGWDDERRRTGVIAAVSGAWGGVFTSPYVTTVMLIELSRVAVNRNWRIIAIQVVAALLGFSVFFAIGGWADVLRLLDLPGYELELWHLPVAVLLGALGAGAAVLFMLMSRAFGRIAELFGDQVVLRCTVAGVALGALGMALPLTLFQGTSGLEQITSDPESLGIGLIVVSGVAKLAATSGALRFGFVGGPVFPLLFVGGCLGEATHLIVPGFPEALAVTTGMASVPAGAIPIPLSVGLLVVLIAGTSLTLAVPVFTAALASFLLVRGLGLAGSHG